MSPMSPTVRGHSWRSISANACRVQRLRIPTSALPPWRKLDSLFVKAEWAELRTSVFQQRGAQNSLWIHVASSTCGRYNVVTLTNVVLQLLPAPSLMRILSMFPKVERILRKQLLAVTCRSMLFAHVLLVRAAPSPSQASPVSPAVLSLLSFRVAVALGLCWKNGGR